MAKVEAFNTQTVINELAQGRGYANELKEVLHPSAASRESCVFLLEKIVCNLENVLARINCGGLLESEDPSTISGSSQSSVGSPRSGGSDPDSNKNLVRKNFCKKRKTLPRWSEQVHETGLEGKLEDGYYWRKYGQKDILGATHPRAYYRCTHRDTQGCLATKQVQRKEGDPSVFEVLYRGNHTCVHERLKRRKGNPHEQKKKDTKSDTQLQQMSITAFKPDKVDFQENPNENENLPPLAILSTSNENVQNSFFWEHEYFIGTSYSPPIFSPQTSESYFSQSSCQMTDFGIGDSDFDALMMLNPTPTFDFSSSREFDHWISQVNFDSPLDTTANIS